VFRASQHCISASSPKSTVQKLKSVDETTFEQYRESLKQEATRLACWIRVYRLLHERREDRLAKLNVGPGFFLTVQDALFSVIVIWIDKLFAEDADRGLRNLLKFVEHHRPLFSAEAFKRRRNLPDGDKSKVFNVALDPITNDAPQFAQVLIPVPLSDAQKKRLIDFLQNL
jgi:hypothetical protein